MYLVFTCMPGKSYCKWLKPLLCLCDVFQVLINSLAGWFCMSTLGLILFEIVSVQIIFWEQLTNTSRPRNLFYKPWRQEQTIMCKSVSAAVGCAGRVEVYDDSSYSRTYRSGLYVGHNYFWNGGLWLALRTVVTGDAGIMLELIEARSNVMTALMLPEQNLTPGEKVEVVVTCVVSDCLFMGQIVERVSMRHFHQQWWTAKIWCLSTIKVITSGQNPVQQITSKKCISSLVMKLYISLCLKWFEKEQNDLSELGRQKFIAGIGRVHHWWWFMYYILCSYCQTNQPIGMVKLSANQVLESSTSTRATWHLCRVFSGWWLLTFQQLGWQFNSAEQTLFVRGWVKG